MDTVNVGIRDIKINKANPRTIRDAKFNKLVDSLLLFPEMLNVRPVVVSKDMTCLGGNMRARALIYIAGLEESDVIKRVKSSKGYGKKSEKEQAELVEYWGKWHDNPTIPVVIADSFTDGQAKEFVIKDNSDFGEWDWEMLANEWDEDDLEDWGVSLPKEWTVNPDEYGEEFILKDGEKTPVQHMSFILSQEEAAFIKNAISEVKKTSSSSGMDFFGNKNSNGNALYTLVVQWDEQRRL